MKWKSIIATSLVPLNVLLLFVLVFESKIEIPAWLQVVGRLHPVLLHFPIVLILLYLAWQIFFSDKFRHKTGEDTVGDVLLLFSALTAVVTSLMGFFLAKEPGYDSNSLQWHKYLGIATSVLLFILYNFRGWLSRHPVSATIFCSISAFVVIFAGHLGGEITHGENFVLSPVNKDKERKQVAFEDALVYEDLIEPILAAKCMSCHNNKKAKGQLVMETKELLLKGGKNGILWDSTKPNFGLMMSRIHLPEEEKKHMPPAGKPQLTAEEINILYTWVRTGADMKNKVADLSSQDSLRMLASTVLGSGAEENYSFAAADESTINKLSNNYRVVNAIAENSPALSVIFYNRHAFNSKQLEELNPISNQIVSLSLENMPIKDEDLKVISQFKNLRKLNLNFSDITGANLDLLKNIVTLKSLSLSGTKLKTSNLYVLASFTNLKNVYLWSTGVTESDVSNWHSKNKNIHYDLGFRGENLVFKLTPPIVQNEENVFTQAVPLQLKHYIPGVNMYYTFDGKEPDSIQSPSYNNKVLLPDNEPVVTVKAKAFKEGWINSDVITTKFFKSTYTPDTVILLTEPDIKYRAKAGKTLIDKEKSELSSNSYKWLGYRNDPFVAMMEFPQPIEAKNITISLLKDLPGFIFPPSKIEIWGGENKNNMAELSRIIPKQPDSIGGPRENLVITASFKSQKIKYVKFVLQPVPVLPKWHPGKGQKGWVFVDEIFVN